MQGTMPARDLSGRLDITARLTSRRHTSTRSACIVWPSLLAEPLVLTLRDASTDWPAGSACQARSRLNNEKAT
jgi:hypothetical protein